MAATAHADPYAIFMRKIGYSVGLESTLHRVNDLVATYLRDGDVSLASWDRLVSGPDHWDLKTTNIADVFRSLGLIHRTAGDVLVLENLDAMAIAGTLLQRPSEIAEARAFLLLWAILVNDGEIFVNVLLAGFKDRNIEKVLTTMMHQKRSALASVAKGKESIARINRIINIDRQVSNRGSAGAGRSVGSLRRTEPLRSSSSRFRPNGRSDEIVFSDDYFRKVPPRRRDWARDLGLWEDELGLTQRGKDFVRALRVSGYVDAQGVFTFWPMDYELRRSGLHSNLLPEAPKSLWTTLLDFADAYSGRALSETSGSDPSEAVTLLRQIIAVYRRLHVRKGMLRRELPILVAYPVLVACASATRSSVVNMPDAIAAEQSGMRRIAFRRSRNMGGALTIKT
ncbi:MAG: hypothetical protein OXU77_20155 [Gammaproteobacteria bacterium]|nr:hypothetical protein [Gammaproteobacteria bacterium]